MARRRSERENTSEIFNSFADIGKNNITATKSDFTNTTGVAGTKDIIRKVLLGGNVRDTTEFITQRRLINSYAAILDLFVRTMESKTADIQTYADYVSADLARAGSGGQKLLDLWLLGLTKKGMDNIVRDEANLTAYKDSFATSTTEAVQNVADIFGDLSGSIVLNGKSVPLNWKLIELLAIAIGSQTLSIRGSAKSMNGKLFEKLILGSLLTIMGFRYLPEPPERINTDDKLFWLSNMDENERETDATIAYKGTAISIDIGFIGKGNPEISLDKVTRFNRYKQIAGIGHEMKTIIIVDTVGSGSDLFNKAERVEGIVLEMSKNNWVITFAKHICEIYGLEHPLTSLSVSDLNAFLKSEMDKVDINKFII